MELFATIAGILRDVTGEDAAWVARIAPESALEGDLGLDSVEVAALDHRLRAEYGDGVDLMTHLGGLDIDALIAMTVGDLVTYVDSSR